MQTSLYCLMFHGTQMKRPNPRELGTWRAGPLFSPPPVTLGEAGPPGSPGRGLSTELSGAQCLLVTCGNCRRSFYKQPAKQLETQGSQAALWEGAGREGGWRKACRGVRVVGPQVFSFPTPRPLTLSHKVNEPNQTWEGHRIRSQEPSLPWKKHRWEPGTQVRDAVVGETSTPTAAWLRVSTHRSLKHQKSGAV